MNLYFDTSALMKKYIDETGSSNVDKLFLSADQIFVSAISEIESISTLKRLVIEKEISENDFEFIKNEIKTDFSFFSIIGLDPDLIESAVTAVTKYQLKSLDSIQLGSAVINLNQIDYFVSCDRKLLKAAQKEGFKIINPNI
ncbi:MAG: type II toxin-antitoxin system VapC family toxin [Spirochaetota bacterium]